MPNSLEIQQPLSADRQVVKINEDSTGLLFKDNRVFVEEQPTEVNEVATKTYVDNVDVAGKILGYTRIANDGTGNLDNLINIGSSMAVLQTASGTDVSVTFTAPSSGSVEIEFSARLYTSSTTVAFALSDDASFSEIDETQTYDAGVYKMDETDVNFINIKWAVTGLTNGTTYTYYIAADETSGSTSQIAHGRFRTTGTHYPPIIVKAVAIPVYTVGE